jgi:hypothetical protein
MCCGVDRLACEALQGFVTALDTEQQQHHHAMIQQLPAMLC